MIFKSLLRDTEIGSNCYMLDTGDCKIVFDAGMHPKEESTLAMPQYEELQHNSVDAIFLSHSHLDHAGTLPVLMRDQPDAPVYMTEATAGLTDALLHNSVNVMQSKRTELGITDYPLYGHRELDRLEMRWRKREYGERIDLTLDTSATLHDAGHILGSAGILVEKGDQRVFYTGDINFENQTQEQKLCDAILDTIENGGSALIPVFAMGKTQEVLTMLHKFKTSGRIPEKTPIFIGGLSTKMTILFDEFAETTPRQMPGFEIFRDMDVRAASKKGSRKPIAYQPGAIYALSSGMMTEKTTSNSFAHGFISNPNNSLLFVGYAAPDSPAGAIREANTGDVIKLSEDLPPVPFKCRMEIYDFSGHADRDSLLDYMLKVAPKKLFLVHGDIEASEWFLDQLTEKLPNTEVIIPKPKKHRKKRLLKLS